MPRNLEIPRWARGIVGGDDLANNVPVEAPMPMRAVRWDNIIWDEAVAVQMPIGVNPEFAPPPPVERADNNSSLYDKLLNAVKEIYGVEAMIAGGAVRDFTLGLQCKDVDLFVPLSLADFKKNSEELGWQLLGPRSTKKYNDIGNTERFAARAFGHNIDIVLLGKDYKKDPITVFPSFATRCRYTEADGFVYAPEFLSDMENKTITISKDVARDKHKQWQDKFNEWTTRNSLKDWTFQIEGVDPNWWRK